ncbi:MAG TPA: L,D-transpeptidase family protein [Gemmatimonadaceae bacterium]|nr:L,D-transpeptidase family protein [Gemmatimonadaceae bacterium]
MIHITPLLLAAGYSVLTAAAGPATADHAPIPAAEISSISASEERSPAGSATAAAPETGALTLYTSLTQRTLYVRIGDSVAATYPVAIGKDDHATPTGTFTIRKIVWNPGWVPPRSPWARGKTAKPPGHPENPMKLVKIFFREPDYYIHGTSEYESLGSAASHGCLRMLPDEAAEIAKWLMEHGGNPKPESWFQRIMRFRSEEHVLYLQNPITLTIEQ